MNQQDLFIRAIERLQQQRILAERHYLKICRDLNYYTNRINPEKQRGIPPEFPVDETSDMWDLE